MNKKKLFVLALVSILSVMPTLTAFGQETELKLNTEYSVQNFKFTFDVVRIVKEAYPMGMFSGRPHNPDMDKSLDGVLGLEMSLKAGKGEALAKLDAFIINEKGEKNVKADMTSMAGDSSITYMFNVPTSAVKIKFSIGGKVFNLEKVLSAKAK